ncbi:hypothetical protein RFI_00561 [Reticulomyxa filosa]|uniref:F-box domain-containing protein n=1 Tax=Reticulomyxa filosa TaxID=46433 RepID=X6PEM9_RETFI|nr:hypothetical protein RFI_00561 [Reticulomyxa filosa]|eukprot:ETO36494.1 hypothetical protein RFI_00561 [Reticulomyxa filosa]
MLTRLHDSIIGVFEYLSQHELVQCHQVCGLWNFILKNASLLRRSELRCFYSKESFTKTMIGMMLQYEMISQNEMKRASKKKNINDNAKKYYVSKFKVSSDYISLPAWSKLGIRIDSTKEKFTHFLPLVINLTHGEKSLVEIKQHLALLTPQKTFSSKGAMDIICELLSKVPISCCIVFLLAFPITNTYTYINIELLNQQFTNVKTLDSKQIHHFLSVWSCLHHLLLFLNSKYPEMSQDAEDAIDKFVTDSESRSQENWPHLGKVLISTNKTETANHLQATQNARQCLMWQFTFLEQFNRPFADYNRKYGGYNPTARVQLEVYVCFFCCNTIRM